MVCYLPIPSPFIGLAGHWVDDALSFAMGWNFFLNMGTIIHLYLSRGILAHSSGLALGIPYEIVALDILLRYWTDKVPVAVVVVVVMIIYAYVSQDAVLFFPLEANL